MQATRLGAGRQQMNQPCPSRPRSARPAAAVIGAGVSGLTAAHVLSATHAVTVFESDARLGGHAHTHDVPTADGRTLRVDSGFIVHNERTYPRLLRLFRDLDVPTQPDRDEHEHHLRGLRAVVRGRPRAARGLAQPRRVTDARFLRMVAEVLRFHRAARALLEEEATERRTPPGASSSRPGRSPSTSSGTSPCPWSPASGPPATPTRPLPGPAPVPVPRPPRDALGAITYSVNEVWLHRTPRYCPLDEPLGRRGTTGPTAPARSTASSPAGSR